MPPVAAFGLSGPESPQTFLKPFFEISALLSYQRMLRHWKVLYPSSIVPTSSADRPNITLHLLSARSELAEATTLACRFSSQAGLLTKLTTFTSELRLSPMFLVLRVLASPSFVLRSEFISVVGLCAHKSSLELKRTGSLLGSALVHGDRFTSCERTVQSDSLDFHEKQFGTHSLLIVFTTSIQFTSLSNTFKLH